MNNNKKEENKYLNDYGEFISSYFKWDTIEKHSDGKYYYHKRSGEVTLNGSEDWISANADANNTICTRYYIPNGESINSVAPNMIVNSPTFSDYIKSRKYQSDSHGQYEKAKIYDP